jgi:AcrR family transcriptional regulator
MSATPSRASRDPEGTRRRILDAALEEFATKGTGGARVDAIAERAGVNKRMIYHYFGSKDGLYRAVLQEGLAQQPTSTADQEHRLLRLHDRFASNPKWVRLLMWEALERGDDPVENEELRREGLDRFVGSILADQAAGVLPAEIDARQLALTELAIALMPFAFPQLTRMLTDTAPESSAFRRARRAHLTRLAGRVKTAGRAAVASRSDVHGRPDEASSQVSVTS